MNTIVDSRELTAQDRCDSCNAAAKVVSTFINGEPLFCGHHAREFKNVLIPKAIRVYDPEGELNLV